MQAPPAPDAHAAGRPPGRSDAGSLANCPVAASGKYRTIDYTGATRVHTIDFGAKTLVTEGTSAVQAITTTAQACEFIAGGTTFTVSFSGAGAFRSPNMTGYFFPVQAHTLASIVGSWDFPESGINETNAGEHFFGKFTIAADGSATVCDYTVMSGVANFTTCNPDTDETVSVQAGSSGSLVLTYGAEAGQVFGYRAPNGSMAFFGTNNPSGSTATTAFRTHFVLVKLQTATLQAVGAVNRYWDIVALYNSGSLTADPVVADFHTVTATDTAAGTSTRTRNSEGRVDTFRMNYPVEGLRFRAASTGISSVYGVQLTGLGLSAAIDNSATAHFYSISVARP